MHTTLAIRAIIAGLTSSCRVQRMVHGTLPDHQVARQGSPIV
jgi:hypothetical protein